MARRESQDHDGQAGRAPGGRADSASAPPPPAIRVPKDSRDQVLAILASAVMVGALAAVTTIPSGLPMAVGAVAAWALVNAYASRDPKVRARLRGLGAPARLLFRRLFRTAEEAGRAHVEGVVRRVEDDGAFVLERDDGTLASVEADWSAWGDQHAFGRTGALVGERIAVQGPAVKGTIFDVRAQRPGYRDAGRGDAGAPVSAEGLRFASIRDAPVHVWRPRNSKSEGVRLRVAAFEGSAADAEAQAEVDADAGDQAGQRRRGVGNRGPE